LARHALLHNYSTVIVEAIRTGVHVENNTIIERSTGQVDNSAIVEARTGQVKNSKRIEKKYCTCRVQHNYEESTGQVENSTFLRKVQNRFSTPQFFLKKSAGQVECTAIYEESTGQVENSRIVQKKFRTGQEQHND
jgi:hypothetical protein